MAKQDRQLTKKMQEAMESWPLFNAFLRDATEAEAAMLLEAEQNGKQRTQYLMRAHSRFNRERAQRERNELLGARS